MKLKATNPLVLLVGALAIGLAGCADDVIITEPPPPPPPPEPEAAEISIVSIVDIDDGTELGESEDDVDGVLGIVINFDTGGFEAAALDLLIDSDVVGCQTFSGQAAVGFSADVQTVQCRLDTREGLGVCVGQSQLGRFSNGEHTLSARLTLQGGTAVTATWAFPLDFDNSNVVVVVPNDIGPRVVSVANNFPDFGDGSTSDGVPFWGGVRDLSWFACPVIFDSSFEGGVLDVCEIEISGRTLSGAGHLDLGSGPGQRASSMEPFTYTAAYRDSGGDPENEDLVEDRALGSTGSRIGNGLTGRRFLACDGTDVTSAFGIDNDERHLDMHAPFCDSGGCEPEIDFMDIGDDASVGGDPDYGFVSAPLYSGGGTSLDGLEDEGVGGTYGVTVTNGAFDCTDSPCDFADADNQTLILDNVLDVGVLDEDDVCPDDETTEDSNAAPFQDHCTGDAPDAGGIDAYYLVPTMVADLLGNALGDGPGDEGIFDQFDDSDEFGIDFTSPNTDDAAGGTTFQPDDGVAGFVWNPVDPVSGDIETFMFEAVDPDLASGDAGSRVANRDCAVTAGNGCDFVTTDWEAPGGTDFFPRCNETDGSGDTTGDGNVDTATIGGEMYECSAGLLPDSAYSVTTDIFDQAIKVANLTTVTQTVIIDTTVPMVQPFSPLPPGVVQANAAIQLDIGGSVSDLSGLSSAVMQIAIDTTAAAACGDPLLIPDNLVPEGSGPGEVDDNTQDVTSTASSFLASFVIQLPAVRPVTIKYCYVLTAEDNGLEKDGSANPNVSTQFASTVVDWQP